MSLHDPRAHAENHAAHARLVGLLRDREQRLLERQRRFHQSRELPRDQREIRRGKAALQTEPQWLMRAGGFLFLDLGDRDRQQALVAQELPYVAGRVPFDDALSFAACGVDRDVFERPHRNLRPRDAWTRPLAIHAVAAMRSEVYPVPQSSRVTLRTSSIVVTPDSTLARPSSRMPGVRVRA